MTETGTCGAAGAAATRRRLLRGIGSVAGGSGAGAAAVACVASGGSPEESVKAPAKADIRMMFFHSQWKEAFDEVIRNFQQKHPGITVEFGAPPSGYTAAATTALASGAGADVMSVNWDLVRTWSLRGNIFDLTAEANKDRAFAKDLAAYHPKIQALMKWEGKQRGVGLDHDDIAVYWNVSLFKQMQLRPLTEVHDKWTWDDLLDIARRATKKAEQQYGFWAQSVGGQTGYWNFVYANGGELLDADGASFSPHLENAAVEAIQWITDTGLRHGVSPQPDEIRAAVGSTSAVTLFTQGKLAMLVDGSWRTNTYVNSITGFEWDVAHLPHAPRTRKRSSVLHGTGFMVNAAGKAIDAAVTFAKHLATRETHKVYGATGIIQSARMDEWDGFYANPKPPKHRSVMKEAVDYAHQHPLTGQWGVITYDATDPIEEALTRIFAGERPVREGLAEGVNQANQNMAKFVAEVKATKR